MVGCRWIAVASWVVSMVGLQVVIASAAEAATPQSQNTPSVVGGANQKDDEAADLGGVESKTEFAGFEPILRKHVEHLATTIGERNLSNYKELCQAADYVSSQFTKFGFQPKRHSFKVRGLECFNIAAELQGAKRRAVTGQKSLISSRPSPDGMKPSNKRSLLGVRNHFGLNGVLWKNGNQRALSSLVN